MLVRVRVAVLGEPASITIVLVLEDMPKSTTLTVMVTVCDVDPLDEAVTVTVYVEVGTVLPTVIVSTELTGPVGPSETVVGFRDGCGPIGFTTAERARFPVKLFTLVRVTVAVVEEPAGMFKESGLATMVKSGTAPTVRVTVVVRDEVPMEPVTVIVYEPVGVLVAVAISSVEFADPPGERVTLCGIRETTRPLLETA